MSTVGMVKENFLPYIKVVHATTLIDVAGKRFNDASEHLKKPEAQQYRPFHLHWHEHSSAWNLFSRTQRDYSFLTVNLSSSAKPKPAKAKETQEEKEKKEEEARARKDSLIGVAFSVIGAVTVGYFGQRFMGYKNDLELSTKALQTLDRFVYSNKDDRELKTLRENKELFLNNQHTINTNNYREALVDVVSASFALLGSIALFCNAQGPNSSIISAASRMLVFISGLGFLMNKAFNWQNATKHARLREAMVQQLPSESREEEGQASTMYPADKIYRIVEQHCDEFMNWKRSAKPTERAESNVGLKKPPSYNPLFQEEGVSEGDLFGTGAPSAPVW